MFFKYKKRELFRLELYLYIYYIAKKLKKMKWLGILTTLAVLIALSSQKEAANNPSAASGSVAQCYVCNENNDERCKDPFKKDSDLIKACEGGETFCRKMAQTGTV